MHRRRQSFKKPKTTDPSTEVDLEQLRSCQQQFSYDSPHFHALTEPQYLVALKLIDNFGRIETSEPTSILARIILAEYMTRSNYERDLNSPDEKTMVAGFGAGRQALIESFDRARSETHRLRQAAQR